MVQGPVQTFQDRPQEPNITTKCLKSVREHLPGATIILSTWPDQDLTGLDYDELVISADPGPNIRNMRPDGTPQWYNNNRQIVSSLEGLKRVKTQYAVKLRSDNFLVSNGFVALHQKYKQRSEQDRFLRERVVVSDVFTRKYAKGFPVAYHVSDFFYFGLTEDVLALWNFPLFNNFEPTANEPISHGYPNFMTDCTQALFLGALQQFDPSIRLNHLLDNDEEILKRSNRIIANNLIVAPIDKLGLGLCQKFLGTARVSRISGRVAHLQFFEWQQLYKEICDPNFKIDSSLYRTVIIFLYRCLYVFPTRLQTRIKLKKLKNRLDNH